MLEYRREHECRYKYCAENPDPGDELKFFEELSKEGWELVAYDFGWDEAIFKRPKNVSSPTITETGRGAACSGCKSR